MDELIHRNLSWGYIFISIALPLPTKLRTLVENPHLIVNVFLIIYSSGTDSSVLEDSPISIEYDLNRKVEPKRRKTSKAYTATDDSENANGNRIISKIVHGNTVKQTVSRATQLKKTVDELVDDQRREENKGPATDLFFSRSELDDLENKGFPEPLTQQQVAEIDRKINLELNEDIVVCCVCDELCRISQTKLLNVPALPPAFFTVLRKPTGSDGEAPILHDELVMQYDVSFAFPEDVRFKGVLLSPRGVKQSNCDCQLRKNGCCFSQLYICQSACLQTLRRGKIPKFAVAQGNWIGQLPSKLRDMTYGSRCLIRPVQSFGRLASFYNGGGMRLTGHVYSNKLNTPFVRKQLPIKPSEVPVRVLVVSPLASDASTAVRARIASLKEDYVIQPEKIRKILNFFKKIGNKVMTPFEFDEHALLELPKNEVSKEMFHLDDAESISETLDNNSIKDCNTCDDVNDDTGGPSLSRTKAEEEEAVMISSTVTVGAPEEQDKNIHEQVVRVLNDADERNNGALRYC